MSDPDGFRAKFDSEDEEQAYYEWERSQRVASQQVMEQKPKSKVKQYINAVIDNTAEEIKGAKAERSAQSAIVTIGTIYVINKVASVKKSDYVRGGEKVAKLKIIAGGYITVKAGVDGIGSFFESTATKLFIGPEKFFDEHLGGNKINIFIDNRVEQIHKLIGD